MKKPNFFLVGAPKCGTTALYRYLQSHPRIFLPEVKEPHYFATDFPGMQRMRDESDYMRLFRPAGEQHAAIGEGSVMYLCSVEAVANLRRFNPNSKLIVMLREPAKMLHSLHSQYLYSQNEDEASFERAWRMQEERAAGRSIPKTCVDPVKLQYARIARFAEQVERVYQQFPAEQVKVILQEDFNKSPKEQYEATLAFLGLESDGRTDFPRFNANKKHRFPWLTRTMMHPPFPLNYVKKTIKGAFHIYGASTTRRFYETLTVPTQREAMPEGLRQEIREYFREDVKRLESILKRDLNHWMN